MTDKIIPDKNLINSNSGFYDERISLALFYKEE